MAKCLGDEYGGGKRRKRRREGGREGGVSPIYSRRAGFPPPMLPKPRPAPTKMLYPRRWARPVPQYAPSPEQHANRTMASGRCYWPCGIIWGGATDNRRLSLAVYEFCSVLCPETYLHGRLILARASFLMTANRYSVVDTESLYKHLRTGMW